MGMVLIPSVSRALFRFLATASWIACAIGILWWHLFVGPGIDGSEGAGVGFGFVAVHCGGPLLAATLTALLGASDWLLRILRARPAFVPL